MLFPLETEDDFSARWDRTEAQAEAAQHRNDAFRQFRQQPDPRDRAAVLRDCLETADRYLLAGIWNDHQHAIMVHDVQEELALLEAQQAA